ncbi:transporter substrate-binding domain-containing protein [Bradyrhizobium mercantei]|uniref:transporter substrate-binding domain-containing protein n=1 Tax=Bradyrhizobium mercantei TaxID=1904807 RepID=UPI0009775ED3|nr:transporter substrate-binding domain-containing protein [Bradyrhizobium mercantei]
MNRRTFLTTTSAAVFALALGASGAAADSLDEIKKRGKIRIGVDLGSPPFGMTDAQMKPTGSDVESARLIAEGLGVSYELIQVTGPNRVPTLLTGQADIVMASFSVTPERKQVIDFSDAYGVIQVVIAAPASTPIKTLNDLASLQIGTTRGTTGDLEAAAQFPTVPLTRYDDDATLVTGLVSKQLNVMVSSPQIVAAVNKRRTDDPLQVKIILKTNPYAIGIRKGDNAFRNRLNEIIAENLANGKLDEIYTRYNGVSLPKTMPKT